MIKKSHIYWYCQILGWSFYILINSVYQGLSSLRNYKEYFVYFIMLLAGIAISHSYRALVKRMKILSLKVPAQLIFILLFSFLKAILFFILIYLVTKFIGVTSIHLDLVTVSEYVLNFTFVFVIWNGIYFGFQYFQNYRRVEINSLRYLAASRESELNNLKAQLNPHFIFNCMNSIRALIDEDPLKAKAAVTQLSNMLRSTLKMDKTREITLKEEMSLVNDFLQLEKIRYEDRLQFEIRIEEETNTILVPPFIIQAQVENAIKHGISKLPGTGHILIETFKKDKMLNIRVSNTGKLSSGDSMSGVGFTNSVQRLHLLYGALAGISIVEQNNLVIVAINIPLKE